MASPLSVKKNDYNANPKRADIPTPMWVCEWVYQTLSPHFDRPIILDPSCGDERLTKPWRNNDEMHKSNLGYTWYSYDIKNGPHEDFLLTTPESFKDAPVDLVICNPPFNQGAGKMLAPELFLRHIFDVCGPSTPVAMFVPMGFRLNQRKKSKRIHWLIESNVKISSIASMTLDVFDGVQFHNEILFFNMPFLDGHYYCHQLTMKCKQNNAH